MTQKLLTLPFRLGFGAARTALDISVKTLGVSAKLAGTAVEILRPHDQSSEPSPPERSTDEAPEERREVKAPRPRPPAPPRVNGHSASPAAPPAPPTSLTHDQEVVKTLEDEDELVAEFAEPGAEDGAGAQLDVAEPWEGYARMNAADVVSRIDQADPAELALLELYEQAHKKRRTVLTAATRRLRVLTPSQAQSEAPSQAPREAG
jgi:hypothetical protein